MSSPDPAAIAAAITAATSCSDFAQTSLPVVDVAVASFDAAPAPVLFTARTRKA